MKSIILLLIFSLLLQGCNQQPTKHAPLKGELVFLLQYNDRLPSDVGFLTNHIMERRLANLMKENYKPFMDEPKVENPIAVDSLRSVITAVYTNAKINNKVIEQVIVDVANDAIWVDYIKSDTALHYADRTTLSKPEL